jgi:hypothetical protein
MEPRRRAPDEPIAQRRDGGTRREPAAPSADAVAGAEGYPFDPALRAEEQRGLDRLRCIKDRQLASYLYQLHAVAERNSKSARPTLERSAPLSVFAIRATAERALAGEFGCEARELAEYLLLDETGRPRMEARSLREFAQAFAKLRRG